jgi:hypothetical protein
LEFGLFVVIGYWLVDVPPAGWLAGWLHAIGWRCCWFVCLSVCLVCCWLVLDALRLVVLLVGWLLLFVIVCLVVWLQAIVCWLVVSLAVGCWLLSSVPWLVASRLVFLALVGCLRLLRFVVYCFVGCCCRFVSRLPAVAVVIVYCLFGWLLVAC